MREKISKTLESRASVYGDYPGGIRLRDTLMAAIEGRYEQIHEVPMPRIDIEHFRDIIEKISRVAATPRHIDSWYDIAGYALLVEKDLQGDNEDE